MQTEILSFKIMAVKCLQLRLVLGLPVTSWVGDITTLNIYINPLPGTCNKGGEAMLRCFSEEEELLPCRKNYKYIYKLCY